MSTNDNIEMVWNHCIHVTGVADGWLLKGLPITIFFSFLTHSPLNPLTQVPSTACDVISCNGQGQLCQLTCAGWRDLLKENSEKNNHVTLTQKFPWKSCSTTHLSFLSSNPKILKLSPKTFSTKMKLTELRKLIFCFWIRRPPSVRPGNGFVVRLKSL